MCVIASAVRACVLASRAPFYIVTFPEIFPMFESVRYKLRVASRVTLTAHQSHDSQNVC